MTMLDRVEIRALRTLGAREIAELGDVLIDCVEGGASVGFMYPMTRAKADAFWQKIAGSVRSAERVLLAAHDAAGTIVGTAQLVLAQPENQPHRGDLSKMLVHRSVRKRGVGAALLEAAERQAIAAGKTVVVLDTASEDAERLYLRHGWTRCGVIPSYALMPDGVPCATTVYFKSLPAASASRQSLEQLDDEGRL